MSKREASHEIHFLAGWAAGLALLIVTTLWLNDGRFAYSLDDPYIHLALAENIADGHYGLNREEVSSPSSSILWPLVLAPFASWRHFELVPLVPAALAMAAALIALVRALRRRLMPPLSSRTVNVLLAFLFLGCNFLGMPLNGMEHSLQLLLTAWVAIGLLDLVEEDRVGPLFLFALSLGPLIRFENASLLLMGAVVLELRGHRRAALLTLVSTALVVVAFALFLVGQGLPVLPSSVLVKAETTSAGSRVLMEVAENVLESLGKVRMLVVLAFLWGFRQRLRSDRDSERASRDRLYLLFLVGIVGAHMIVGKYNSYGRYEVYLLLTVAVVLLHAFRYGLADLIARRRRWAVAGLVLAGLILGQNQIHATFTTPLSANDVYEMHHQMRRFAVDYWRDDVAVNDIGWVSFGNPYFVLDLWGLASEEARRARLGAADNEWAERLVRRHKVDVLFIFDEWFIDRAGPLPATWEKVAVLNTSGPYVQVGKSVNIFLRNPARRSELLAALVKLRETLPPGAELRFEEDFSPKGA